MKTTNFTIDDYRQAMKRELQKRIVTYPKIIIKKMKQGLENDEIEAIKSVQMSQVFVLRSVMFLVRSWP